MGVSLLNTPPKFGKKIENFWPAEPLKMIFLTRFGLMGLLPIDLSQKIALKRDSQSSKSSSDDPFQAIFHFFIDFSREEREKVPEKTWKCVKKCEKVWEEREKVQENVKKCVKKRQKVTKYVKKR